MRKPNPERIYQARRAANFRRLVDGQRLEERGIVVDARSGGLAKVVRTA